jgi:hypothetical protein
VPLALVVSLVLALDAGLDAAPAPAPVTNVDFGEGETEEAPEMVTSRKEAEFGTLIPDRFQVEDQPPPPPAPRRRGGCSGCASSSRSSKPDGSRWGVALALVAIACRARVHRYGPRSTR